MVVLDDLEEKEIAQLNKFWVLPKPPKVALLQTKEQLDHLLLGVLHLGLLTKSQRVCVLIFNCIVSAG